METSIANKVASATFSFLLLLCAPLAQAGMLTFDDLDLEGRSSANASILNSPTSYGGFTWDNRFYLGTTIDVDNFEAAATSGTQFLFNKGNQRKLKIKRETPFDFLGASFGLYSPDAATRIKFSAWDPSVSAIVTSGYQKLNGTGVTDLSFFLKGIYELEIDTFGGTFAMDNFSFRDVAVKVTEAGSLALLVIGLIGLWAARRRGQLQA